MGVVARVAVRRRLGGTRARWWVDLAGRRSVLAVAARPVAVGLAAAAGGLGLGAIVGAAMVGVPRLRRWASGDPVVAVAEASLAEALAAMARAVRTGASLAQAVGEGADAVDEPFRSGLAEVAAAPRRGSTVAEAADHWAAAHRAWPGANLAGAAIALAAEAGGAPGRSLDGVAATLHERANLRAEGRALGAQARYSAWVIALAPLLFGVLAAGLDHRVATVLLATTPGHLCLAVGLTLDAVGAAWMHRITVAAAS